MSFSWNYNLKYNIDSKVFLKLEEWKLRLLKINRILYIVFTFFIKGFVDEKGHPQGLSGLATHLHYHEPSNFILVTFLHEGLLHDFCAAKDARLRGKCFQ